MSISIEKAMQLVQAAHAEAESIDLAVTAVVVDESGRVVALGRMDGARPISVDIAMNTVKVAPSDETRFRIGNYIKAHPEMHEVIRRWGWVTLVLTPDEKLTARAIINAERDGKPVPSVSELATAVGIKEPDVKRGLAMLERYEILTKETNAGGTGYRVMPRYIKWGPRLDFVFHNVSLDSGRQFSVN